MTHTYTIPRGLYEAAQAAPTPKERMALVHRLFDGAYEASRAKPGDTIILYDEEERQLA